VAKAVPYKQLCRDKYSVYGLRWDNRILVRGKKDWRFICILGFLESDPTEMQPFPMAPWWRMVRSANWRTIHGPGSERSKPSPPQRAIYPLIAKALDGGMEEPKCGDQNNAKTHQVACITKIYAIIKGRHSSGAAARFSLKLVRK
jgi:hypothetical protein